MQKQLYPDGRARDDVLDGSDNIESEGTTDDESESLSDIDDFEVDCYLHNEKEKAFKKIIWEEMNKEYLEEQAAKEVVAANATTMTSAKSRKVRRQKCVEDQKTDPAQSPLESTRMLKKKSSRINYEALEALYSAEQGSAKKQKVEADAVDPVDFDDKTIDSGYTEDGEENKAFEDDNYGEYVGYEDDGYEDYSYDDFDFS